MNSQNDYLKHSPHWIYADVCSWNTGRGQKRTKSLKTVIFKTLCSRCLHFQIFNRSCSSPGTSRIEPGDLIHSFLSQTVTFFQ